MSDEQRSGRQAQDLEHTYSEFLQAMRAVQINEDSYAQGALNGQYFLARVRHWEPTFRATLADVLAFHGAVHHKLYWMREITAYAAHANPAAGAAVLPLYEGNVAGLSADAAAERYYRVALDLDGSCARALFNLGCLLGERGEIEGAIAYLDRAAAVQSHYAPFSDLRAAKLLNGAGRQAEAAQRWKQLAARGCLLGQMHSWLALGLREAGEIETALVEIDRCLDCSHFYAPEFSELRVPLPDFGSDSASEVAVAPVPEPLRPAGTTQPGHGATPGLLRRFAAAIRGALR